MFIEVKTADGDLARINTQHVELVMGTKDGRDNTFVRFASGNTLTLDGEPVDFWNKVERGSYE